MVTCGFNINQLEKNVAIYIKSGWEPFGGVTIGKSDALYQSLVKYSS